MHQYNGLRIRMLLVLLRPKTGRCVGSSGGYQDTFRALLRHPWTRDRTPIRSNRALLWAGNSSGVGPAFTHMHIFPLITLSYFAKRQTSKHTPVVSQPPPMVEVMIISFSVCTLYTSVLAEAGSQTPGPPEQVQLWGNKSPRHSKSAGSSFTRDT